MKELLTSMQQALAEFGACTPAGQQVLSLGEAPVGERQESRLLGQVTGATPEWGRRGPV